MKMLNNKKKTAATLIALLLTIFITTSSLLIAFPYAFAHTPPYEYNTYCYVAPTPPIVGVGQQMLIEWWLNAVPPTSVGATGDRWKAYIDVMKPDGTNETFGPLTSDSVGAGYITYVPDQVGNYACVARFPGQTLTGIPYQTNSVYVNDTFAASTSIPEYFTVQEQPIPSYVETPLPIDYWTRPVYDANRGWGNAVMGQWLGGPMYLSTLYGSAPAVVPGVRILGINDQSAPLSPHILWTRSEWSGGIMGSYVDASYYNGIAYEEFGVIRCVLEGRAYYQVLNPPNYGWYCIDLYNGETVYFENNTDGQTAMPTQAQVLNYESPNQGGGFPYLWRTSGLSIGTGNGTVWEMLDGFSGNAVCRIANVSTSGTQFKDSVGSICYLNIVNLGTSSSPNYYMQIWNTTEAIMWQSSFGVSPPKTTLSGETNLPLTTTSNAYWMWRPLRLSVYDGRNGYSMNVSVASIYGPRNGIINQTGAILQIIPDKLAIVGCSGRNDARGTVQGYLRAYSLEAPTWGQTLWTTDFTPPAAADAYPNATSNGGILFGGVDYDSGTFWFMETVTGKIWFYSMDTGRELWSTTITDPWYFYNWRLTGGGTLTPSLFCHKGYAYTFGVDGICRCFNATTGQPKWNWTAPNIGYLEVQGTTYMPLNLQFFVDDPATGHTMIYLCGSTSWAGQTVPIRRDSALFCLDAEKGEMVWRLEAYPTAGNTAAQTVVISDSRIMYLDNHDNQIYCLGKGPSATIVSAPQSGALVGSVLTITGTVTDQTSSGRHNVAGSLDFTLKGTPAISDESMSAWMEYMFQQRPIPTNATGVPVSIATIDPNGNYYDIGNVTSDLTGSYGCAFTPQVPGTYKIIATFAGSNSYGPSSAQTYLAVGEQAPTAAPAATPQSDIASKTDLMMYVGTATVFIIIAIAIAAVLLLRKKP